TAEERWAKLEKLTREDFLKVGSLLFLYPKLARQLQNVFGMLKFTELKQGGVSSSTFKAFLRLAILGPLGNAASEKQARVDASPAKALLQDIEQTMGGYASSGLTDKTLETITFAEMCQRFDLVHGPPYCVLNRTAVFKTNTGKFIAIKAQKRLP